MNRQPPISAGGDGGHSSLSQFLHPTTHHSVTMRLAYSSNAYLNFSIEETIARIAGLGYEGWNCWPTCRMPGRRDSWTSGSRRSASAWNGTGWPYRT